ncbi:MAG: hypothetical protein H7A24_01210 [Leptospiraceae bacterium]|nr:hypothetical protein [Leptospiraceae bacterium]MCP5510471.1 hypothetical protein [Leptospiraceae bacterium]
MVFGEGSQKINFVHEPLMYVRPTYTYNPIPQVNKIYSNENFFSQDVYKDFKNSKNFKESGETKQDFVGRGAIVDLKV